MSHMEITVRVRMTVAKDGDGYHASVPDMKGIHAYGNSEEEALRAAAEAVSLYVASLIKHREPIPMGMLVGPTQRDWLSIIGDALANRFGRRHSYVRDVSTPAFHAAA